MAVCYEWRKAMECIGGIIKIQTAPVLRPTWYKKRYVQMLNCIVYLVWLLHQTTAVLTCCKAGEEPLLSLYTDKSRVLRLSSMETLVAVCATFNTPASIVSHSWTITYYDGIHLSVNTGLQSPISKIGNHL